MCYRKAHKASTDRIQACIALFRGTESCIDVESLSVKETSYVISRTRCTPCNLEIQSWSHRRYRGMRCMLYGMDCNWSNDLRVRFRRKHRWARSYYISAMNLIEIRGPEDSVSRRSKIMERKKNTEDTVVWGREGEMVYAEHGKAISVQPRFLVSAKEAFVRKSGNLHARLHTRVHRPWKRMNTHEWPSDSRFAILLSLLLRIIMVCPGQLIDCSMKPDENALSISPSLMIINAKHDEISLMEHNISTVLSWYYYLISRTKDTFRRALVLPRWVREIFIIAHK